MHTHPIVTITLVAGMALCSASCSRFGSEASDPVIEEVAQPTAVSKKQPLSTSKPKQSTQPKPTNQSVPVASTKKPQPTAPIAPNLFRTPADDIKLPTDAEMEEGKESATAKKPAGQSKSAPSISVKPSGSPADFGP